MPELISKSHNFHRSQLLGVTEEVSGRNEIGARISSVIS